MHRPADALGFNLAEKLQPEVGELETGVEQRQCPGLHVAVGMPCPTGGPGLCLAVPMVHVAETVANFEGGAVGDCPPDPCRSEERRVGGRSAIGRPGPTAATPSNQ